MVYLTMQQYFPAAVRPEPLITAARLKTYCRLRGIEPADQPTASFAGVSREPYKEGIRADRVLEVPRKAGQSLIAERSVAVCDEMPPTQITSRWNPVADGQQPQPIGGQGVACWRSGLSFKGTNDCPHHLGLGKPMQMMFDDSVVKSSQDRQVRC